MKRWMSFPIGVAAGALAAAIVVLGSQQLPRATAQAPVTLKVQASWPPALIMYDNLKLFGQRVEQLSGGRLKVEALPAGTVVPAFEVLDATAKGVIHGAHTWAGYWIGKHRAGILFTGGPGGPFGMDYLDFLGWMYEGGGWELYQEYYQQVLKADVVAFPIVPFMPQAFGWFKKPIKGWADLKGIKFRIPGIGAEILKEAGMAVVTLPGGEIVPAAERGVIDGAEWVGGLEDLKLGFQDVWKYHYVPGMIEPVSIGELILNRKVWEGLAPDLREIVKAAATETLLRWFASFHKVNAEGYKTKIEKHKVQVTRTPDDILTKTLEVWDRIAAQDAAKDPFYKKVLESQKKYASLVVPYRLSTWPSYELAGMYYWKGSVYVKPAR